MTMVVKTINPVYINNKRESEPSKYLSANGMGEFETTLADVSSRNSDNFYGFDANGKPTNTNETKIFQDWMDIKHPNWANGKNVGKGKIQGGYGTFGKSTTSAWNTYGSEFTASRTALANTLFGGGSTTPTATTTAPTTEEQIEQAKQGKVWDKAKGWVTSGKAKDLLAKLQGFQSGGGIKGLFGGLFGGGSSDSSVQTDNSSTGSYTPPSEEKKGLSKGAKIGIAVGGAVLLGIIIYAVTRPKK